VLTTLVGFTTSIFSATYIAHEIEIGRITPAFLRFYHAMFQAMMGAMNVALVANNIGLMWVGVEVATLSTVMMVGIYRTHEAIEAAWKYFILGSVGIGLAFFGTILIYLTAQEVLGEGFAAMSWDLLARNAGRFDPRMMSLAFVFLLVGYGTKVGLAPFHAWLPDAHAEGPTPISAVLSGLLLNVALYALLRFKMVLAANPATLNVGAIMMALGLISLIFAAFMLYRRRDIKRLFAYSSIEHMGIATFAFGIGGPIANFAGLLHMTMHSLTKSAIFFAVGHIAQVKGTQRVAEIGGLSVTHPVLAVGLSLGVIAIAGLPPFGIFASEFMLVSSTFARQPLLAVLLIAGLLLAFGALVLRLQDIVFGAPKGPKDPVKASYVPLFLHLALVLIAGLWLPGAVVEWFRAVATLLG
jgi:hydrogenase-4 component F